MTSEYFSEHNRFRQLMNMLPAKEALELYKELDAFKQNCMEEVYKERNENMIDRIGMWIMTAIAIITIIWR